MTEVGPLGGEPVTVEITRRLRRTARMVLIANPHSGGGRAAKRLALVREELAARGIAYGLRIAQGMEHARLLSRQANLQQHPMVVAVGGDGTINRVMNGFFDECGRRLSNAVLGVIHTGTSPDLCRSYNIPTDPSDAVRNLNEGQVRRVSVGLVTYHEGPGPGSTEEQHAVFGCCANIGFGAEVARLANSGVRSRFGDFLGTFISLMRALRRSPARSLPLGLDGREELLEDVINVSVGRTHYVASGLKVRHDLSELDERFYVLRLRRFPWSRFGKVARALYSGRPIGSNPYLRLDYARSLSVRSDAGATEVEFDGDAMGWCPASFKVAPDPLEIITRPI